jgi:predicted AAA+ superfamily ATPase
MEKNESLLFTGSFRGFLNYILNNKQRNWTMEYLTASLKKQIIEGGIILSPRRSGKTRAVLELLSESDEYIYIVLNSAIALTLQKELNELAMTKKERCIFGPKNKLPKGKKIIVDELFHNSYYNRKRITSIHCLLGTTPKRLVAYNNMGGVLRAKAEEVWKGKKK